MSDTEWGISSVASVSVCLHTALSWGCSSGHFINEALEACPHLAWLLMSWACLSCDSSNSCCQVCILPRESTETATSCLCWWLLLSVDMNEPKCCLQCWWAWILQGTSHMHRATSALSALPQSTPQHPSLGYSCGQDWLMKKLSEDDIYDLPGRPRKYLGVWQFTDA